MSSRVDSTRAVGAGDRARRAPAARLAADEHRDDLRAPLRRAQRRGDRAHRRRRARRARRTGASASTSRSAWERGAGRGARRRDTRKVALRSAMVMSPDRGGIFDVLLGLVAARAWAARIAGGAAVRVVDPRARLRPRRRAADRARRHRRARSTSRRRTRCPSATSWRALRAAWGTRVGLPATRWMPEIGAFFLRTDTELVFKSRRVVPGRLLRRRVRVRFPSGRRPRAIWSRAGAQVAD